MLKADKTQAGMLAVRHKKQATEANETKKAYDGNMSAYWEYIVLSSSMLYEMGTTGTNLPRWATGKGLRKILKTWQKLSAEMQMKTKTAGMHRIS